MNRDQVSFWFIQYIIILNSGSIFIPRKCVFCLIIFLLFFVLLWHWLFSLYISLLLLLLPLSLPLYQNNHWRIFPGFIFSFFMHQYLSSITHLTSHAFSINALCYNKKQNSNKVISILHKKVQGANWIRYKLLYIIVESLFLLHTAH